MTIDEVIAHEREVEQKLKEMDMVEIPHALPLYVRCLSVPERWNGVLNRMLNIIGLQYTKS